MNKLPDKPNYTTETIGLMVADHVTAMLAYWDRQLICRYANTAYIDWFGKSREEMIGKMTLHELLGPVLFEKNLPYILGALDGRVQTFEREIPTPADGVRYSLANYFPHLEDDKVIGFFVHVADISPVKQLEKELVKSNTMINDQNKRLLNFANIVSHNLGSYASNLKMLTDLLGDPEEKEKDMIFGHLSSVVESFIATVRNLNEIVEVQNLSSIQSREVSLHLYVEKVIEILRGKILSEHADVQNLVNRDLHFKANPAYLESIILNLVSNALRYHHPDRKPLILITAQSRENDIVLEVKDNGLGIDLNLYGKDLFGMYKTFHDNPDAKGLGLFITKFQIEAMGGQVDVHSIVNTGTTFTITIPK
jgi:PAS domain S-box-containing protein